MDAQLTQLYRTARKAGQPAHTALATAKTKLAWDALGGFELHDGEQFYDGNDAPVRLRLELDADPSTAWDGNFTKAEEKRIMERAEREGVVGITGEYKCPLCGAWTHADSCWGFVGSDWRDSGYDTDIMQATIDAYNLALEGKAGECVQS